MSLINLGSISATIPEDVSPNFYVASVVHSKSGPIKPTIISEISQLESFYDQDFKYYDMYRELINKDIPVLLIPILTNESNINRCSLRLSNDDIFKVSYPSINYSYEYQSYNPSDDWIVNSDTYTHGLILDFSNVDISLLTDDNYIRLYGDSIDELNKTSESEPIDQSDLIRQSEFMIWFPEIYNIDKRPPLDRTIIKSTLKIPRFNDQLQPNISSNIDLTDKVKDKLNNLSSCTVRNIDDLIWYKHSNNDTLPNGILRTYIESIPVEFSRSKYDEDGIDVSYSRYIKDSSNEYLSDLSSYLYKFDYGIVTRSKLVTEVIQIFEEYVFLPTYDTFSINEVISRFESGWSVSSLNIDNRTKLLVEYLNNPGKFIESNNLDGFILTDYDYKTKDRICSYNENSKLIEFYSKIKGHLSSDIYIDITRVSDTNKYYQINITCGSYKEYYQIDLDYNLIEDKYKYSNTEYKDIEILKTSKLVDVYIYDYKVYNDDYDKIISRIQSEDSDIIEEYESMKNNGFPDPLIEFARQNDLEVNDIDTLWKFHYSKIDSLPEGRFYLSRSVDEYITYTNEILSYGLINDFKYYPDLILVDNLDDYSRSEKISIIKYLNKLAKSTYSQVLIEVNEDDIFGIFNHDEISDEWTKIENELFTDASVNKKSESRLLYFYGDLTINERSYPTYYPYILNILNSDYIRRVTDKILYRKFNTDKVPRDLMNLDTLDRFNINYLLYNNIYYNYNRIKEVNSDPDFILRFNTSKITRIFMSNEDKLINCEHSQFDDLINLLIDTAINLLPLVTYLNYDIISDDPNKRIIGLSVKLESLTNKLFILNINLNL